MFPWSGRPRESYSDSPDLGATRNCNRLPENRGVENRALVVRLLASQSALLAVKGDAALDSKCMESSIIWLFVALGNVSARESQ